jgi:uncharacterized protein with ATP-grasp and redox domains
MPLKRALPADATPPRMAAGIHRMIRRQTGSADPYRRAKCGVIARDLGGRRAAWC